MAEDTLERLVRMETMHIGIAQELRNIRELMERLVRVEEEQDSFRESVQRIHNRFDSVEEKMETMRDDLHKNKAVRQVLTWMLTIFTGLLIAAAIKYVGVG